MPSPKKPVLVDIEVDVDWTNFPCSPVFSLGNKNGQKVKAGQKPNGKYWVSFNNKPTPADAPTPGFIIFFNIREANGRNACQFLPDPDDAMWVQPSALNEPPCPKSAAYWSQFRAIDVVDHDPQHRNKTLIVCNQNDYEQMFAFTLRFEIEGCDEIFEFDPIGSNQNGDQ